MLPKADPVKTMTPYKAPNISAFTLIPDFPGRRLLKNGRPINIFQHEPKPGNHDTGGTYESRFKPSSNQALGTLRKTRIPAQHISVEVFNHFA